MKLKVDERCIEGRVMEKEGAKAQYDEAIARGHAAALLQQDSRDQDLYEINVGNILAGSTAQVEIVMI